MIMFCFHFLSLTGHRLMKSVILKVKSSYHFHVADRDNSVIVLKSTIKRGGGKDVIVQVSIELPGGTTSSLVLTCILWQTHQKCNLLKSLFSMQDENSLCLKCHHDQMPP